jgi:hypothetical protein
MVFRNRIIDKKQLKKLISWSFENFGTARTAQMADEIKDLGLSDMPLVQGFPLVWKICKCLLVKRIS